MAHVSIPLEIFKGEGCSMSYPAVTIDERWLQHGTPPYNVTQWFIIGRRYLTLS